MWRCANIGSMYFIMDDFNDTEYGLETDIHITEQLYALHHYEGVTIDTIVF